MEYIQHFKNLELPIGASKDEIKSAYKRLSKKYHPDKNKNCDYSEFIKISESYQKLMNIYDYKIDIEDYEFYISNYISIIKYLYEVIRDKLIENTTSWFKPVEKVYEKTKDITIKLDIDLVEIYKSQVKKVTIKVLRKNENKKLILKKEDFYISLFNYKSQYVFKNKADDDLEKHNGDIIINININPNNKYYIKNQKNEKYNLYHNMDVSLKEYVLGVNKFIKILDLQDNIIEINYNKINESPVLIIENKGFSYNENDKIKNGDLIINFKLIEFDNNLIEEIKNKFI